MAEYSRGPFNRMSRSGDQLGVERGRVSQIADRGAVWCVVVWCSHVRRLHRPQGAFYRVPLHRMSPSEDQLGVERGRVSQIADRCDTETATGYVTTVGDPHNSKGVEP